MITLKELKRIAVKEGVPQDIVEKDLALSVALKAIAESDLAKHLVFKGGTALRKVYFREARFSEDLDFTVFDLDKNACLLMLRKVLEGKDFDGVKFEKLDEEPTSAGLKVAMKYLGPLAHAQRIRFDLNFRENLAEKPIMRELLDPYGLGKAGILTLSREELLAEKIHALISRSAPRDLYDVEFLFRKNVPLDVKLVKVKFAYYGEKYDFAKLESKIHEYEKDWTRDLRHLMGRVPDFKTLSAQVLAELKKRHIGDDPITSDTPGVHNPVFGK